MAAAKRTIHEDEFTALEVSAVRGLPPALRLLCCETADDAGITEFQALLVMLLVRALSQAEAGRH